MPFPEKPHLFMAAILFAGALLVCSFGLGHKADLCTTLSKTERPSQVNSYFTRPSSSTAGARTTVLLVSGGLAMVALIPWQRFKSYRNIEPFSATYWSNPSGVTLMTTFDGKLVRREVWNVAAYSVLSIVFCTLLGLVIYKPQVLFWTDAPPVEDVDGVPIVCYPGFGSFMWLGPLLLVICVASLSMTVLSSVNIQKRLRLIHQNMDIAMSDLEHCFRRGQARAHPQWI